MKALTFDRPGPPLEVLALATVPDPQPGPGEVRVRMVASTLNPGDFLFVQGLYPEPKTPRLPGQIAGNHGCGVVAAVGDGVDLVVGTPVAFSWQNAWAEFAVLPAQWLIPLPPGYPTELAAQFFNVVTAWDLLDQSQASSGDVVLVTAGYSAVSQLVIQFAAKRGIDVVSVVRHIRDTGPDANGAATVVSDDPKGDLASTLAAAAGGRPFKAILDSVGGDVVAAGLQSVAFGARIILYGAMTSESFPVSNTDVLLKDLKIGGFTYRFFFDPPAARDRATLETIIAATKDGGVRSRIATWWSLDEGLAAVRTAVENPGAGKQALRLSDPGAAFAPV